MLLNKIELTTEATSVRILVKEYPDMFQARFLEGPWGPSKDRSGYEAYIMRDFRPLDGELMKTVRDSIKAKAAASDEAEEQMLREKIQSERARLLEVTERDAAFRAWRELVSGANSEDRERRIAALSQEKRDLLQKYCPQALRDDP